MYDRESFEVESLLRIFDRPISYHKCLAEICGSVTAGVMLSQMIYWTPRTTDNDRWFYKSMDEWQEETALTRTEQESARKKLKSLGILEEKKEGVPCKLFFRINLKQLTKCLNLFHSPVCRNAANKDESSLQTGKQVSRRQASRNLADNLYTEITTEITDIRADENLLKVPSSQIQENSFHAQTENPRIQETPNPQSPLSPSAPENLGKAIAPTVATSKQAEAYMQFEQRFSQPKPQNRHAPKLLVEAGYAEWHNGKHPNDWRKSLIDVCIQRKKKRGDEATVGAATDFIFNVMKDCIALGFWGKFQELVDQALKLEASEAIAAQQRQVEQQRFEQPQEDNSERVNVNEVLAELKRKQLLRKAQAA